MKSKKLLCLTLTTAFIATNSHALYIQRGERGQASLRTGSGAASTAVRRLDEPVANSTPTANSPTLTCTKENNDGYLPLGFLYDLVDHPQDITLRRTNRNSAIIRVPKHISACIKLDFEFRNVGNDKIVAVKNAYKFTKEDVGVATEDELKAMTIDDRYVACLKTKELLVEKSDGSLEFDGLKAERDGHVTYSAETEFDLGVVDDSKSMKLFFASPKARDYQVAWGDQGVPESPSEWPCLETERFAKEDPYLYVSEEDKLSFSVNQACETRDYETILRELSELKTSSAGNAQDLIKILEVALEDAKDKRIKSIYDRMEEIERLYSPSREDIAAGKLTGLSETRAKTLGREYGSLLEEVNSILYNPAILEIDRLMTEMDAGVTVEREENIRKRIESLNTQIGEFSKKDARTLGRVYDGLKEYALTNEALKIEGFRLKSLNFSKVGPGGGRGRALTIEQADKNIKSTIKRFDTETLKNWEDINLAKSGNNLPIRELQRQSQMNVQRMQRDQAQFVQKEMQQEQKACASNFIGGIRNPMECQRFRAGQQQRVRRFQARQQRQRNALQSAANRATQLEQFYAQAQREMASENSDEFGFYENSDPFGFYDDFSDNSSMYNLGGQQFNNNVMQMGVQQNGPMGPGPQGGLGQPMGLQRPMMGW